MNKIYLNTELTIGREDLQQIADAVGQAIDFEDMVSMEDLAERIASDIDVADLDHDAIACFVQDYLELPDEEKIAELERRVQKLEITLERVADALSGKVKPCDQDQSEQ